MIKKILILIILILILFEDNHVTISAKPMEEPPQQSDEELYHDMFISLILKDIQTSVDNYYSNILKVRPLVYPYQVEISEATRVYGYRSFRFFVKAQVTPVVGPHITVGKDQLVFDITGSGQVKLIDFIHIKSHELPKNWQHILKDNA